MFGKELKVFSGRGKAGDFIFSYQNDKKLGKEGYTIRIADKVVVSAPQSQGVYWATRTLLQMAAQEKNQALPKGSVRDCPGIIICVEFMIDCGRKFIPMSFLRVM